MMVYLLTPWSRVLLEKLTGSQLIMKFPTFYGTRKFITAFTRPRHLNLSKYQWTFREDLLAPRPTPKLEDHSVSAVRDCLFNLFAATLHIWRPFLHPQTEEVPCRGDRDPLVTESVSLLVENIVLFFFFTNEHKHLHILMWRLFLTLSWSSVPPPVRFLLRFAPFAVRLHFIHSYVHKWRCIIFFRLSDFFFSVSFSFRSEGPTEGPTRLTQGVFLVII